MGWCVVEETMMHDDALWLPRDTTLAQPSGHNATWAASLLLFCAGCSIGASIKPDTAERRCWARRTTRRSPMRNDSRGAGGDAA